MAWGTRRLGISLSISEFSLQSQWLLLRYALSPFASVTITIIIASMATVVTGTEVGSDYGAPRGTYADEESVELEHVQTNGFLHYASLHGERRAWGAVVLLIFWISGVGRQR